MTQTPTATAFVQDSTDVGRPQVVSRNRESTERDSGFDRLLANAAILVVDDELGICNFLKRALEPRCAMIEVASSAEEAEALRLRFHFDVLIVDIRLPGLSGLDWLAHLRERGVRTHVIYMTAYADLNMAIEAIRHGAHDFVLKPFRIEEMTLALGRTLTQRQVLRENSLLKLQLQQLQRDQGVVGESAAIRETLELAQRVAPTPTTVLIEGETGTGKELVARTVHQLGRRSGAFVAVNCGTVPGELFESELFGHVRGAFSGAVQSREGLVVHAERGTLFLDEIGELPLSMQAKLLRVLEERMIRPVGAEREIPVDVRVLAATNRDLAAMVEEGTFRQDLYFRLNVLPIKVPPLRDRLDDLPLLVSHFIERLTAEMRVDPVELMHTDYERLRAWRWPGNVRELRNIIERTLLLGRLPADSLRHASHDNAAQDTGVDGALTEALATGYPLDWPMEAVERAHMQSVLASHGNNKSASARQLGVSRKTLERKEQIWARETEA